MNYKDIKTIAVIGAGKMGKGIAGKAAEAGLKVYLCDVGDIAKVQLSRMWQKGALSAVHHQDHITPIDLIKDGYYCLSDVQWVVEAATEELKIKKSIFKSISEIAEKGTLISSNTSGLNIDDFTADMSSEHRANTAITHFFNPVFYQPLVELVAGKETSSQTMKDFHDFMAKVMCRGPVTVANIPGFAANRLGGFLFQEALRLLDRTEFSFATVDEIFDCLFGWKPFKTADLVGIDVLLKVISDLYINISEADDPLRVHFQPIAGGNILQILKELQFTGRESEIERGFYGFIKKAKQKFMFSTESKSYIPYGNQVESFPVLAQAVAAKNPVQKMLILLIGSSDRPEVQVAKKIFSEVAAYTAFVAQIGLGGHVPTVMDQIMETGYGFPYGVFKRAQVYGERLFDDLETAHENVKKIIPTWFQKSILPFYDDVVRPYYSGSTLMSGVTTSIHPNDAASDRSTPPSAVPVDKIFGNNSASVYDTGEGVYWVEFHTGSTNPLDFQTIAAVNYALDMAEKVNGAVFLGNLGTKGFCAGANLKSVLTQIQSGDFDSIDKLIVDFQTLLQRMKYGPVPTVVAPHGITVGGGCEFMLAATRVVAYRNLMCGLVEVGAGVLPAGNGVTNLLLRYIGNIPYQLMWQDDWKKHVPFFIKKVWDMIAYGKVSTSAENAREMGFLRPEDIVVDPGELGMPHVLYRARQVAVGLVESGYTPPPLPELNLPGLDLIPKLELPCEWGSMGHFFPEHMGTIGKMIAAILCGGGNAEFGKITTIADLSNYEREFFMELVHTEATQKMIASRMKM